jgi:methionyl-tRNA formyltransferase
MKYIFFGTPEFAAIILEKLIKAGYIPSTVVCNPDKPVGRKKIITAPETKLIAQKYNIPVWQLESLKTENLAFGEVLDESQNDSNSPKSTLNKSISNQNDLSMANLLYQNWDFFVVAAYAEIIPKEILEIPRLGTIGIHPSLLPKYRGASPIQSAILNGDEITGTTLYLMDEKMDHGPILVKRELKFPISPPDFAKRRSLWRAGNFQFSKLYNALAELSADLLIETLPNIEEKIKNAAIQNELQVTYTKKFSTQDAFIKPDDLEKAQNKGGGIALEIERKIRALNPEPGTFTFINEKRIKLLEAQIIDKRLKLTKIQVEGKKPTLI